MDLSFIGEFVVFLLQALIAWFVISLIIGYSQKNKQKVAEEKQELVARAASMVHQVKEEEHGGTSYWYDRDTGQFLGQGRNLDEMRAHLKTRFKEHIFVLPNGMSMVGPSMELLSTEQLLAELDREIAQ